MHLKPKTRIRTAWMMIVLAIAVFIFSFYAGSQDLDAAHHRWGEAITAQVIEVYPTESGAPAKAREVKLAFTSNGKPGWLLKTYVRRDAIVGDRFTLWHDIHHGPGHTETFVQGEYVSGGGVVYQRSTPWPLWWVKPLFGGLLMFVLLMFVPAVWPEKKRSEGNESPEDDEDPEEA